MKSPDLYEIFPISNIIFVSFQRKRSNFKRNFGNSNKKMTFSNENVSITTENGVDQSKSLDKILLKKDGNKKVILKR